MSDIRIIHCYYTCNYNLRRFKSIFNRLYPEVNTYWDNIGVTSLSKAEQVVELNCIILKNTAKKRSHTRI